MANLLIVFLLLIVSNVTYSDSETETKVDIDESVYMLSDDDKDVRKSAINELATIGGSKAEDALNDLWIKEMDESVIFSIELALHTIHLKSPDIKTRLVGAKAIGAKAETLSATSSLEGAIQGDELFQQIVVDKSQRLNVLVALKNAFAIEKNKKVKNKIEDALQKFKLGNSDAKVRREAAEYFGEMANPDNIMVLGRSLENESDPDVRLALEESIRKTEKNEQIAITLKQLFNGITVSSQYLLIAIGLAITFGVMGIINLAHGEFIMLGCYVTLVIQSIFATHFQSFLGAYWAMALPSAFIFTAGLGYMLERYVLRFLYARPLDTLLATWGVSLILQQAVRNCFGANNIDVPSPTWLLGGIDVFPGLHLPFKRLYIIGFSMLVLFAIYWLFYRTRLGLKIRAVMQNRNMANCVGISTRKVNSFTFAIGSGLAGLAGCNMSLLGSVGPSTGQNYIVDCFMVVVLGGVGRITGTLAGAFGLGETNAILEFFTTANIGKALTFLLVIIFLRFRPTGFSATKVRDDKGLVSITG
ncbi:MAG: urea ABC transporter permease subunit UrtB [Candidatus Anammoxibacter sp.]